MPGTSADSLLLKVPASFSELRAVRHTLELYRRACPGKVALLLLSIYIFCQARIAAPHQPPAPNGLVVQQCQTCNVELLVGLAVALACHAGTSATESLAATDSALRSPLDSAHKQTCSGMQQPVSLTSQETDTLIVCRCT